MTSRDLVSKAQSGDTDATERLLALLHSRVTLTADHYSRRTGLDRDDLAQEMWLGILAGLPHVNVSIGDPVYYLFLRGRWRLFEVVRRSKRDRGYNLVDETAILDARVFEEGIECSSVADDLRSRLREPQRRILAGLLQGRPQNELARSLGCSPANVAYHVRKIREAYSALAAEMG